MNLRSYKELKLAQLDNFFRGINFENIISKNELVENVDLDNALVNRYLFINGDKHDINFINRNKFFRTVFLKFLFDVKKDYDSLKKSFRHDGDGDIFAVTTYSEVDNLIDNFLKNVISKLDKLKNGLLKHFCGEKNSKIIGTYSLYDFQISLDDSVMVSDDKELVNDFRMLLYYVCSLPNLENERFAAYLALDGLKNKRISVLTNISNYLVNNRFLNTTSDEYRKIASYFKDIFRAGDIKTVEDIYSEAINYISSNLNINIEEFETLYDEKKRKTTK